ncbi:MAG TPA: hypothetical protein VGG34_02930 [Opitutaceae bacterium]|jgi:hypothetical protein
METELPLGLVRALWLIIGTVAALALLPASAVAADPGVAKAAAADGFTANFAFYPYHNCALVSVDYSNLPDRAAATGVALRIVRRGSGETLASRTLAASAGYNAEGQWALPGLGEGEFELVARVNGTSAAERRVPFERHVFPWEHNSLGKSAAIVPPFSALVSGDDTVSAVLRKHTLTRLGLWKQVNSLGTDLLAHPMRLELRRGSRTESVEGNSFEFVDRSGTRVVSESSFPGGTTRSEWDYDGVMKWTLDLAPDPHPIDSLTLVVPLDDHLMPLMHACTDGIRINYAGLVPAGSGQVWDSAKAKRRVMPGTFVPYIWVGGEERGLAVFGDNDKGWVTAKDVPCQVLRREGDILELRLNLIAGPTVITAGRRITIGFQATPTKPMPADWRLRTLGGQPIHGTSALHYAFLGSCLDWGALSRAMDVYPRNEDFGIWDEFRRVRQTGKLDTHELDDWLAHIGDPNDRERSRVAVGYGFHVMQTRPQNVLVYTNARGVRFDTPEGRTFLNEWDRELFPKRVWKDGTWFDLNPSESFRDYATWYYRRMLTTFADSIYWDDTFLQSVYRPIDTDAYRRPDGRIQPAAGLWDMRALIRRTAVLGAELGKPPTNMVHMTNAAIAPILSFAQSMYTWEDMKSDLDFQDRHTRDYIRAESIGRQHGDVPFAMLLTVTKDPAKLAWIKRTGTGVLLVHEIKTSGSEREWSVAFQKLVDFGYGQKDVRVFNYWDADNPVSVDGGDVATLCVAKSGAALAVVCDYGGGGEMTLHMNRKALGLSQGLAARNEETGEALPVDPDGSVHFQLRRHDYMIIVIGDLRSEESNIPKSAVRNDSRRIRLTAAAGVAQ